MKRMFTLLFAAAMMLTLVVPSASAQSDSTPDALGVSTPESSPSASPMASPEAGGFQEGETDYMRGTNMLTITLTELDDDADASATVRDFDPEANTEGSGLTFEEELDAPEDCRLIDYSIEDVPIYTNIYVGVCGSDDWGLFVIGSNQEAVEHVLTQFADGETDLIPDGYEER